MNSIKNSPAVDAAVVEKTLQLILAPGRVARPSDRHGERGRT